MKKLLLLFTLMVLPLVASADDSGSCGENVTYTYVEATNTLTISGTGDMTNYSRSNGFCNTPWYSYGSSIKTAIIEDGVTSIGYYAFSGCSGLTSVTIPNSVTSIGEYAFSGCNGLTSVTIPNSVTSIGNFAFQYCSSLTSVTIPNSVTSIGKEAFYNCSGLTSITIPNSVTSIGYLTFYNCSGLTSVTIPNSVTSIGEGAFQSCSGLTSVTIPNSVTSIGESAFYNCSGLTSITIPNSVTSIGYAAFRKCSGLTSVTIPNSVTSIKEGAFQSCSGLTSITIPNSVTSIGTYAFDGCSGLTSITIPNSVTIIGDYAFQGCSGLTSITIPNSVTSIGNYAFNVCIGLTSVTIPNSVTSIGKSAFGGCSGLTSVTIPNSVTSIGEYAFYYCSKMETLKLPNELQIIKKVTFYGCSSLKSLTIPASVEFIYQEAFAGCSGLESVNALPQTPPFLYDNSFSNYSIPLKVLKGYKEAYQSAQGWKNFTTIIDSDKYKITYMVDGEEYKSYELSYGSAITPEAAPTKAGYQFSGWSAIPATMPAEDVTITGSFMKIYDVGDLTTLLNYVMDRPGSVFSQLFDLNGDGEVNIGDIVLMVKRIHQGQAARATIAKARTPSSITAEADLSRFTAAQFVLSTDEKAKVAVIQLKGKNRETHRLSYEPMGNGQYSVVLYSTTNQLLTAEDGGFLEVVLADGSVSSEVTTSDVVLSTPDSERVWLDCLPAGATTGINNLKEDANAYDVYNLNGSKEPKQGVRKGIYIIRGKKTVVR